MGRLDAAYRIEYMNAKLPAMHIANRPISSAHSPYLIAEMSANHNGNIETALKIIERAHACGADAVKLQTYRPDTITIDCDSADFQIHGGLWDGRTLYELYQEAHMPWEWHQPLFAHARKIGITMFSSPFDTTAVDLLEDLRSADLITVESTSFQGGGSPRTCLKTSTPRLTRSPPSRRSTCR